MGAWLTRWTAALLTTTVVVLLGYVVFNELTSRAVKEINLPLRHEDIIRQQAKNKGLDPALVAAVIYTESKFRDQTSHAGARGLMQVLPETAEFIARDSGATNFQIEDLATPQVNISYGSYYLKYLLDRYGGNNALAVAAYNGGETNVDKWLSDSVRSGESFSIKSIPFPETQNYVKKVLETRLKYRKQYKKELGYG